VKNVTETVSGPEITAGILAQLVRYLRHVNIDADDVLRRGGTEPDVLTNPDSHIPVDVYNKIETAAAEASGDPCFGLHMGEYFQAGSWSILGYLMMNCRTIGEAMIKAGRYYKIIGTQIQTTARIKNGNVIVVYASDHNAPDISRHCYESAVSSTICMLRNLCGEAVDPVEVGFTSPAPACVDEYRRVFRAPVLFGRENCYFKLPLSALGLPVVCPNPDLLAYFEDYVRNYLAALEPGKPVTNEVIKRIVSASGDASLSIGAVAKQMAVSTRTLQNRLKEEGDELSFHS
jgi:hypothetical protein